MSSFTQRSSLEKIFPNVVVLPDASNDLHLPSGDNNPAFKNWTCAIALRQRLAPQTTAASHCPERILSTAKCNAESPLEQAVSNVLLGPVNALVLLDLFCFQI